LLSVIIVNYNSGAFLCDCVQSALSQADEVLVVDNASKDDSLKRLTSCFANESKLKIIHNDTNQGFAAACNVGIRQAKGNRFLFLNPDCRLEPGAAPEMLRALEASDAAGMAGGLLTNPDGSEQPGGRRTVPTPWRSFVRVFGLSRFSNRWPTLFFDFLLHNSPLPSHPETVEAVSGACMLVKREAINDVGLWDESYFLHCEDLDWCMRFRQKGWKVMFVPAAHVVHHLGTCSKTHPIFVEWHKHKGMMRFYRKFFRHQYPYVLMWIVAVGVWLRFSALTIHYSVRHIRQWLTHGHL
jgi:GT2 family glycosyltransferase